MSQIEDHSRRAREELTVLGVPRWAQSGASGDVRYHAWVVDGIVEGRLVFPTGGDEAHAIRELLTEGESILSQDESDWPPPSDLSRPCAVLVLRPNGFGHGGCPPTPEVDRLPLGTLIREAMSMLQARLEEIATQD